MAKEKVLIIDFEEEHHIHPEDVHPKVYHRWSSEVLENYGPIDRCEGKEKFLYMPRKER